MPPNALVDGLERARAAAAANPFGPMIWGSERDYLSGKGVRSGDLVELRTADGSVVVRYELVPGEDLGDGRQGRNAVFHLALAEGRWAIFGVPEGSLFRWPLKPSPRSGTAPAPRVGTAPAIAALSEAGVNACASMTALAEQLRAVSLRLQERLEEVSNG